MARFILPLEESNTVIHDLKCQKTSTHSRQGSSLNQNYFTNLGSFLVIFFWGGEHHSVVARNGTNSYVFSET
jgi:hypothetical protein